MINNLDHPELSTPADLINNLNRATIDLMGEISGAFKDGKTHLGPFGNTWAVVHTTGYLGIGPANKLSLGWKFFYSDTYDQGAVVIHEAFHLFSGNLFAGYGGIQDLDLWKAAGVSSTDELNRDINTNCPQN